MLTRIEVRNFRSLFHANVALSRHHVLVGPNGAGKSTFLDTVGFVADFVRMGAQAACLGDDRFAMEPRVNRPQQLLTHEKGNSFQVALEAQRDDSEGTAQRCRYELEMVLVEDALEVAIERFSLLVSGDSRHEGNGPAVPPKNSRVAKGRKAIITHHGDSRAAIYTAEVGSWRNTQRPALGGSALAMLTQEPDKFPLALWFRDLLLEGTKKLTVNGPRLRLPAPPGAFRGLHSDGSNLANAVEFLTKENPAKFAEWLAEIQTAIPDLVGIHTVERQEDRRRYVVATYLGGHEVPSFTMSDGTLRLLLLTLIQFLPGAPAVLLVEEPENGIHPKGIETVYRSLKNTPGQVLCATHSPVVVNQAKLSHILCVAKDAQGHTSVVAGDQRPEVQEWMKTVDKGTLFANGVL